MEDLSFILKAIMSDDENVIALEAQRLPPEADELSALLRWKHYGEAVRWIKNHHENNDLPFSRLIKIFAPNKKIGDEEVEIAALKLEFMVLEDELASLTAKKAEMERCLAEFNAAYMEQVGPLLEDLLLEIIRQKKGIDSRTARRRYERAYEEFQEVPIEREPSTIRHLGPAEKRELERMYSSCHPNCVHAEKKEAATILFQRLQKANRAQDIEQVQEIWQLLVSSDNQKTTSEILQSHIEGTRDRLFGLSESIESIGKNPTYQFLVWLSTDKTARENYFQKQRAEIEEKILRVPQPFLPFTTWEQWEHSETIMQVAKCALSAQITPRFVKGAPWVKELIVWADDNEISEKEFPRDEEGLSQLQELLLGGNITDLPEAIGYLRNLETLDLEGCALSCLPDSIGNLHNLKTLNLRGNDLSDDSIDNVHDSLDLEGNDLSEIPESIGNLYNLKTLNLGWNTLSEIPESIGSLYNLQTLCLEGNDLSEIPDAIAYLGNLSHLRLGNNNISKIPSFIGDMPKLKCLDLSNNPIKDLPLNLKHLGKITTFFE